MRVGFGYDAHRLIKNRPLILGGITIPSRRGLKGHSDADVLVHAIMDALLGAAALGDIGRYFPDTDNQYKGISSIVLLEKTGKLLAEKGYSIVNIDSVISQEKPKLAPHIAAMRERIAQALGLKPASVSVKATTTEGMGFTGRGEGVAAYAVALISG